jgi:serine/threonine protein kinase
MLMQCPGLTDDQNAQFSLALQEYEDYGKRGDKPAPMSFAARFPAFRTKLLKQLLIQEELDKAGALDSAILAVPEGLADSGWPEVGDRLLGFNLLRRLGAGAFSRVYLAKETALGDRLVAVKVSFEGRDLPDAAAEAEILGRLPHQNIMPIYSIQKDTLTGSSVVCMPYLGNATLNDVLDHVYAAAARPQRAWVIVEAARLEAARTAPPDDMALPGEPSPVLRDGSYVDGILDLGIQLADALAYVHRRNVFHRDLKPSNVLVRPDGRPVLLDFNLSSDMGRGTKQFLGGTLLYMSPEQLRATAKVPDPRPCLLDARSDLFSLGVILFELFAGDHPFVPWKSPEQRLSEDELRGLLTDRQAKGPASMRRLNPQIDKHLAGVIEKCLALDAANRFPSAAELAEALRHCRRPEHRARRWLLRHPRRALLTLAGILMPLIALFAVIAAVRAPARERYLQEGIRALQTGRYEQATDSLSRALAEEESFQGYMARARSYQRLGRFKEALADFKTADGIRESGHTKACVGYCFSRLETPNHRSAALYYSLAKQRGYATAVVYNNLAFSFFMSGTASDYDAKKVLRKAIALDPGLQAPYYNFVKIELETVLAGYKRAKVTAEGLTFLDKVFTTGVSSGEMHADAVHFLILAKKIEPQWKQRALCHLELAIRGGWRPVFSETSDDPAFREVLRNTVLGPGTVSPSRIQDPFLSIDE